MSVWVVPHSSTYTPPLEVPLGRCCLHPYPSTLMTCHDTDDVSWWRGRASFTRFTWFEDCFLCFSCVQLTLQGGNITLLMVKVWFISVFRRAQKLRLNNNIYITLHSRYLHAPHSAKNSQFSCLECLLYALKTWANISTFPLCMGFKAIS